MQWFRDLAYKVSTILCLGMLGTIVLSTWGFYENKSFKMNNKSFKMNNQQCMNLFWSRPGSFCLYMGSLGEDNAKMGVLTALHTYHLRNGTAPGTDLCRYLLEEYAAHPRRVTA